MKIKENMQFDYCMWQESANEASANLQIEISKGGKNGSLQSDSKSCSDFIKVWDTKRFDESAAGISF